MAKAEFGTPKFVSNQMKMKGLQKLKWYCQVCEKQCRDDNGFKCHIRSETHIKRISSVSKADIANYSKQFQDSFIAQLRNYHGEKKINANRFYNQLIQQKDHVHLSATRWTSLSQFIQDVARQGIINTSVVDETDQSLNGVDISYINNSGDELVRKAMLQRKDDADKNDEALGAKILQQQIKRGQAMEKHQVEVEAEVADDLETHNEPIKISLSIKKPPTTTFKRTNAFKIQKPTFKSS